MKNNEKKIRVMDEERNDENEGKEEMREKMKNEEMKKKVGDMVIKEK